MPKVENVFVLIPAYNAGETIERVFERIPPEARQRIRQYVAVDDGSTDTTPGALARLQPEFPSLTVLTDLVNRGYGETEKRLLRYAVQHGADVGILLHADGQYSPEKILDLLQPFDLGNADILQGSRLLDGGLARRDAFI